MSATQLFSDERKALIEEAERLYKGALLHDDVDYEVGLVQRLALALAQTVPHLVFEPSDEQVVASIRAYGDVRRRFGHMNSAVHADCLRAALRAAHAVSDHQRRVGE